MIIRSAQPGDGPQVLKLVTTILAEEFPSDQAAYSTQDLENLTAAYEGPASAFFVAEEGDRIIGTCGVKADDQRTAILRRLFVDPGYRGRGIGIGLLQEALRFCRTHGFQEVIIRTSSRMSRAIRLCQSLGFEADGDWTLGSIVLVRYRLKVT